MADIEIGAPGGSTLGIGIQSAYDTAVARTMWVDCVSVTPAKRIEGGPLEVLTGAGAIDSFDQRSFVSGQLVEIEAVMHLTYDGPEAYILAHLAGKWATGSPNGGVYPHTAQTCLPHEWHQFGLTLEVLRGRIGAARLSEVFTGCVAVSGSISMTPDQPVRLTVRFIGRTGAGRSTAGAPTYQAGALVMGHHCTGLTWTGVLSAAGFASATLAIDMAREVRREVGSMYTQFPTQTGRPSVTLQCTRVQDTHAVYAAHHARTRAEVALAFAGASPNTLEITLQAAETTEDGYSDPISGPGYVEQSFTLRAMGDSTNTDPALLIEIENDNDDLDVSP